MSARYCIYSFAVMLTCFITAGNIGKAAEDSKLIIPSPKKMELESFCLPVFGDGKPLAVIILPEKASPMEHQAAACLNDAITEAGGKPVPVLIEHPKMDMNAATRIYLGAGAKFMSSPLNPEELKKYPLGSQGYLIRSFRDKIVLTGENGHGVLYAAVTAAALLEKHEGKIMLRAASVSDWPDFRNRMLLNDILGDPVRERKVMPNEGHGDLAVAKRQIDWALRYKFNLIQADALMFKDYLDCEDDWDWIRQVNEYAALRGIKILFHDYHGWAVGKNKKDKDSADFKSGVNSFQNHFYTWSRNDLLERKAEKLRRFVAATGTRAVGLHAQDYWDGNWDNASRECKDKFKGDRVAADANVINTLYRGLKAGNPDIIVNIITFPYSRNLDLPGNEKLRDYYQRLTVAIPDDIWLTCAGYSGEAVDSWHRNLRQPLLLWINNVPFGYGCFFDWSPRFFRSIYREEHSDDIVMLNHPYSFFDTQPVSLIGMEYQWNTMAPGYGIAKESEPLVKDGPYYTRTLSVDGMSLTRWVLEHGTDIPHPENGKLLKRICGSLYGGNIGDEIAEMLLCGVTDWVVPDWRWIYTQNETMEVIENELRKSEKALKILEDLRAKKLQGKEKDTATRFFNRVYHRTAYLRAKHLTASATDAAVKKDFARAGELADKADKLIAANIKLLQDRVNTRWLYLIDTNTWYKKLKQDVYFLRLKLRFSKPKADVTVGKVAIYNPAGRGGSVFPFQTIYNTLIRNGEISVEYIDNLRDETLAKFKMLVIPQVKCWGEGDAVRYRQSIRKFVSSGGGAYFEHDANGWKHPGRDAVDSAVFPEISTGVSGREPDHPGESLSVKVESVHPALGNTPAGTILPQMYWDHNLLNPGPDGKVLACSSTGKPVLIAGSFGRGRVLCNGMVTLKRNDQDADDASGIDKLVLNHGIPWLSGK